MAKVFAAALLIAFSVFAGGAAYSQSIADEDPLDTVDGRVLSVDSSGSRITIDAVNKITFTVPLNAVMKQDVFDIKLSDIKTGDYVTIGYRNTDSGKHEAHQITIHYNAQEGT